MARSLNARTIYGACIIIYRVKLFSFNCFIRKKITRKNCSRKFTRRKLSELRYVKGGYPLCSVYLVINVEEWMIKTARVII